MDKLNQVNSLLRGLSGAVVAFSGGVDSTLLAYLAQQQLGDKTLAVTAVSPTYPEHQLVEARQLAEKLGINHQVIHTNEFESADFTANPPDRCYYCKKELFADLRRIATEKGWEAVLDGANFDDLSDHRPGHRAAEELGIRSPLQEVGLTKQEIRDLSQSFALPTWDKPAYACIASRIPYGRSITPEALTKIDQAEEYLLTLGFREVRVRDHSPVARIEVGPAQMDLAWEKRSTIAKKLHEIGFIYVTLDLDGFRSGSMNEVLKK